jgi:Tat protein translocase TatB subunit
MATPVLPIPSERKPKPITSWGDAWAVAADISAAASTADNTHRFAIAAQTLDPILGPGYVFDVFGLGFGEMVVLGIVLLVVVGPRELPKLLRSVGKGLNKLRRMSTDLREQSGIDEIIKDEGLREDLDTLRQLSRGRSGLVDGLMKPDAARRPRPRPRPRALAPALDDLTMPDGEPPDPDAEYPLAGPDAYGSDETRRR